jgi:hypothetical protein
MDKETLFKAIQRREVVLWAGAGFSRYAGFKLGAGVVHHLFDTLSTAQQQQARAFYPITDAQGYPAMALPAFASLYVNLHNGQAHALRREVSKLFTKRPTSLKTHQQLASIPFIEHIVTTNFDTLFEQAYGSDKLHVVTDGTQLPYQDFSKTTLYKVHGSIENLNSLVLTEEDYRAFYTKSDKLLWGYIESLMATRTLLFVGYGLEDPNVLGLFEQLLDTLGSNMRNAYLVAPGLNPVNVDRLRRRNVTYIDSTGEELVEELLQHLKDTTLPDLKKGGVTVDHTSQFLRNLGLQPTFQATEAGYEVTEVKPISGSVHHQINFTLDRLGKKALLQFQKGVGGVALKFDTAQLLACSMQVAGINLGIDIKTLWVVRVPKVKKVVDVEFSGGLLLQDVNLRVYGGEDQVTITAYTPSVVATITIPTKKMRAEGFSYNFTLTRRNEYYDSVDSGVSHSKLMQALGRREAIKCVENGRVIWENESAETNMLLEEGERLEKLMLGLQRIEKVFGIRFRRFHLKREDVAVVRQLSQILEMQPQSDKWTGHMEVKMELAQYKEMAAALDNEHDCYATMTHKQQFNLMDWELEVEYRCIRRAVDTKIKKAKKGHYRLYSGQQLLETFYSEQLRATVLKQGIPLPQLAPEPVDLPVELDGQLLK